MVYVSAIQQQRQEVEQLLGKKYLHKLPQDFDHEFTKSKSSSSSTTSTIKDDINLLENPRICKSYIVGKCPYEIFENTKENVGKCFKIHNKRHKLIYENAKANHVQMPHENYELDYMSELENFISDCDSRVKIANERLDYSEDDKLILNNLNIEIENLNEVINIIKLEISLVREHGYMDKLIELNENLEKYVTRRIGLTNKYSSILERLNVVGQQKLQVCECCGAYMMKVDTDKRLVDHYMGKIHMSYVEIRQVLKDLKEKYRK